MKIRLFVFLSIFMICTPLHGQDWSATLMIDPNPSPYVSDWQADPTLASLEVFNHTDDADVIIVRAEAYRDGNPVFKGNSGRILVEANDLIRLDPTGFRDWFTESVNPDVQDNIERTGMLPEGDYEVCLEVVNLWETILAQNLCSHLTITHPEPPELIYPIDHETVFENYPVFQWIPPQMTATKNFVHVFRLVELLEGQLPEIAVEANYPHYENFNVFDSNLEYPLDGLLLEPGKTYVWQVQALDFEGRPATKNNGYSELGLFTVSGDLSAEAPPLELVSPEQDALIMTPALTFEWAPPLVTLEGLVYYTLRIVPVLNGQTLEQAMIQNAPHFENAAALMETSTLYPEWADSFTPGMQYAWQVMARDHYGYPVTQNDGKSEIRGFTYVWKPLPEDLSDLIPERLPLPSEEIAYLQLKENEKCLIEYELSEDTHQLVLKSPAPNSVPLCLNAIAPDAVVNATVDLTLNRFTLEPISGTMTAENNAGPGSTLDLNPAGFPFIIRDIQYDVAGGSTFQLQAAIALFDEVTPETPVHFILTGDGMFSGHIDTGPVWIGMPLVPNHLTMNFTEADGLIHPAQGIANADYTLNLYGSLEFADAVQGGEIPVQWVAGRNGWQISVSGGQALMPAGAYQLTLDILDAESIAYESGFSPPWQFDFLLDVTPEIKMPGAFALPKLSGLHLTQQGLHFIESDINLTGEGMLVNGLRITPDAVHIQEGRIDVFDGISQPDIRFDLSLEFTGLPERLHELAAAPLTALNVEYRNGSFGGPLEPRQYLNPLRIPLDTGESPDLRIQEINGSLTGNPADPLLLSAVAEFVPSVTIQGMAALGPIANLSMDLDGIFTGNRDPAYSDIDLPWGDLTVHMNKSMLYLSRGPSGQAAGLRFDGSIRLPACPPDADARASGRGRYNLITAQLDSGEFFTSDPFTLPVPALNPVFSLRCTGDAAIDASGITFNDANGEMILEDGSAIPAAYSQNAQVAATNHIPQKGTIAFTDSFALRIRDLNKTADQMTWKSVPVPASADSTTEELIITVPKGVRIVEGSWQFPQTTSAHIRYGGLPFNHLKVECSADLDLLFEPFRIKTGRIQLFSGEESIALLDSRGFWPGEVFPQADFQNLVRLPLPDETVAYIRLKDDTGNWLLNVQDMGVHVKLSTNPSGPVSLVLPGLRYAGTSDPEILVRLENVLVNKSNRIITGGTLEAADGQMPFSLLPAGLPIELTGIDYAVADQKFMASVRPLLPKALESESPTIPNIPVTQNGLNVFQAKDAQGGLLASKSIGPELDLTISSIDGAFLSSEKRLVLTGQLFVHLFQQNGLTKPIDYTMTLQANKADFTVQLTYDETNKQGLSLDKARLDLTDESGNPQVSIEAPFDQDHFILRLNTLKLSLPDMGSGLLLVLNNLIIDKEGIHPPNIPTDPVQVFQYGGLDFTLTGEQKAAWEPSPPRLMMTLGGTFQLWNRRIPFSNLILGTDGSVSAQNLLPDSVQTLNGLLAFTGLYLNKGLKFETQVKPPVPFDAFGITPLTLYLDNDGNRVDETGNPITNPTITILEGESETGTDVWLGKNPMRVRCRLSGLKLHFPASLLQAAGNLNMDINTYWPTFDALDPNHTEEKILLTGLVDFGDGRITGESWILGETTAPAFVLGNLIRLEVDKLSATADNGFSIQLCGNLTLHCLSGGSAGGCQFEKFVLKSGAAEFGTVSDGELDLFGLKVSVSNFDCGTDPLSFDFASGNTTDGTVSHSSRSTKGFYATFKASVKFGGGDEGFEAGVDQFIIYKDADWFYLLFDNANFKYKDAVEARLDMEALIPLSLHDFQFQMSVGGSVKVEGLECAAVGEVAFKEDMVFGIKTRMPSFGLFFGLMGQKIPLAPLPITLTDIGGGFFFNPTERIENWVYANCGLNNESEWLQSSFGEYTKTNSLVQVFLLAGVALPEDNAISGRGLFTLASDHIRLDASLEILKAMSEHIDISANGHLELGFQDLNTMGSFSNFFIQGNLDLQLKLKKLSDMGPQATMAFGIVYYDDQLYWGLQGDININLLNILKENYVLILGNPGFLIQGNIHAGFDIGILSVNAGLNTALWIIWDASNPSIGAYIRAHIAAKVFWGAAAAKGELGAALLFNPDPYFYGYAKLRIRLLFVTWKGSAWAKWSNGSFKGGLGGNPGLQVAIAEAAEAAKTIRQQTGELSESLNADNMPHIPLQLTLTDDMLNTIIQNISAGRNDYHSLLQLDQELIHSCLSIAAESPHTGVRFLIPFVRGAYDSFIKELSRGFETSTIQQLNDIKQYTYDYQGNLKTRLQDHQTNLNNKCQAGQSSLKQLQTVLDLETFEMDSIESNLNSPIDTIPPAATGDVTMPSFNIDHSVDKKNETLLNDYSIRLETELPDLQNLIETLDSVRSAIYMVIGPEGVIKEILEELISPAVEEQMSDQLFGQLEEKYQLYQNMKNLVIEDLYGQSQTAELFRTLTELAKTPELTQKQISDIQAIFSLAVSTRNRAISAMSDIMRNINATELLNVLVLYDAFNTTTQQLYGQIPKAFASHTQSQLDSLYLGISRIHRQYMSDKDAMHRDLTEKLDILWDHYTELTEKLYTAYQQFIIYAKQNPELTTSLKSTLADMENRMNTLEKELYLPSPSTISVTQSTSGNRYDPVDLSLNLGDVSNMGIIEYAYTLSGQDFQATGKTNQIDTPVYPANIEQEENIQFKARYRNTAGLTVESAPNNFTIKHSSGQYATQTYQPDTPSTPPEFTGEPLVIQSPHQMMTGEMSGTGLQQTCCLLKTGNQLHVAWPQALSASGGIAQYEISVWPWKGGSPVLDWTPAISKDSTSVIVAMETGRPYEVQVRARDLAGLTSISLVTEYPLVVNPNIIGFPENAAVTVSTVQNSVGELYAKVDIPLAVETYFTTQDGTCRKSCEEHYEFQLLRNGSPIDPEGWEPVSDYSSDITVLPYKEIIQFYFKSQTDGLPFNQPFRETFKIALRVKNDAGSIIVPATPFEVRQITDPSKPSGFSAEFRGWDMDNRLLIKLGYPSSMDMESGIAGIQVAVGRSAGDLSLRPFQTGSDGNPVFDFGSDKNAANVILSCPVEINGSILAQQKFVIVVRMVNGQGLFSETVLTHSAITIKPYILQPLYDSIDHPILQIGGIFNTEALNVRIMGEEQSGILQENTFPNPAGSITFLLPDQLKVGTPCTARIHKTDTDGFGHPPMDQPFILGPHLPKVAVEIISDGQSQKILISGEMDSQAEAEQVKTLSYRIGTAVNREDIIPETAFGIESQFRQSIILPETIRWGDVIYLSLRVSTDAGIYSAMKSFKLTVPNRDLFKNRDFFLTHENKLIILKFMGTLNQQASIENLTGLKLWIGSTPGASDIVEVTEIPLSPSQSSFNWTHSLPQSNIGPGSDLTLSVCGFDRDLNHTDTTLVRYSVPDVTLPQLTLNTIHENGQDILVCTAQPASFTGADRVTFRIGSARGLNDILNDVTLTASNPEARHTFNPSDRGRTWILTARGIASSEIPSLVCYQEITIGSIEAPMLTGTLRQATDCCFLRLTRSEGILYPIEIRIGTTPYAEDILPQTTYPAQSQWDIILPRETFDGQKLYVTARYVNQDDQSAMIALLVSGTDL